MRISRKVRARGRETMVRIGWGGRHLEQVDHDGSQFLGGLTSNRRGAVSEEGFVSSLEELSEPSRSANRAEILEDSNSEVLATFRDDGRGIAKTEIQGRNV